MILVDHPRQYSTNLRYKTWSHMHSDTSLDELHAFAAKLKLKREWFQPKRYAHYDILPTVRMRALTLGAIAVTAREGLLRNFDYRTKRGFS